MKIMIQNRTYSIELFPTPVRPTINPRFIDEADIGTISNPDASRESRGSHLSTQKLATSNTRPGQMIGSNVSKGTCNTVHVVICCTLCDAHNTGGFDPRYCARATEEGC